MVFSSAVTLSGVDVVVVVISMVSLWGVCVAVVVVVAIVVFAEMSVVLGVTLEYYWLFVREEGRKPQHVSSLVVFCERSLKPPMKSVVRFLPTLK